MKEQEQNRFNEQVEEILGDDFKSTLVFDDEKVIEAKINTDRPLLGWEVMAINVMANAWFFKDVEISRSSAGLRIEFIEFKKNIVK